MRGQSIKVSSIVLSSDAIKVSELNFFLVGGEQRWSILEEKILKATILPIMVSKAKQRPFFGDFKSEIFVFKV